MSTRASRRRLAIAVAAAMAGACQTESPSVDCQLAENSALPGSPLMSSRDARIDRVAQWFVLLAADGNVVRWSTIESDGQAGPERSVAVPTFTAGPWFAVAGDKTAGDSVVIAFGKPASSGAGADLDLFAIAVPSDGSASPGPPLLLATIPGAATASATVNVVMGSSVTGMRAALAWVAPTAPTPAGMPAPRGPAAGAGTVKLLFLAGSGQPIGAPVVLETVAGSSCLGFVPGRHDLTLGYLRYETATAEPEWSLAEFRDNGASEFSLTLPLGGPQPSCPGMAPTTAGGYVLSWQDTAGSRIGVYDTASNRFYPRLFVTAVEFGGADIQPPVVGLGEVGRDFAVIFARARGGEVWRIGATGIRRPGALFLPSVLGDIGQVSSVPLGGALYATYADYSGTAAPADAGGVADAAVPADATQGADAPADATQGSDAAADAGGAADAGMAPEGGATLDAAAADRAAAGEVAPARAGRRLFVKITCF